MNLRLKRRFKSNDYTIGSLYIDNIYFSDTLEDFDRGLSFNMDVNIIISKKIYGKTAIPKGIYDIDMTTISNRFGSKDFYKKYANGGRLPRLKNVKGFDGVLIHCGNTPADTHGCVLVGLNKIKGQVVNSRETFKSLYSKLEAAHNRGEKITLEIV